MIKEILFSIQIFKNDSKEELFRSRKCFLALMEALTKVNLTFLKTYASVPLLYDSNVIYKTERKEIWRDIPTLLKTGFGDCEDLSCYRIAELNLMGIAARPYIKWRKKGDKVIHHALVELPDGRIEDPSLALGMGGHIIVRRPIFINP